MNDMIYWAIVAWGGIALLIEAFRNYNLQTGQNPFRHHPILKDVAISDLATDDEFIVGYCFYSFLYLVVYAVCFGSAEVLTLLQNASVARAGVGAVGDMITIDNDPLGLSATPYAKPILVSTILISLLSVGAVRPFELFMRGLAHRVAGIPRGTFRTIENLSNLISEGGENGIALSEGPLTRLLNQIDLTKVPELDQNKEGLIRQLNAIDCLGVAVDADHGKFYFPLMDHDNLGKFRDQFKQNRNTIESSLKEVAKHLGKKPNKSAQYDADLEALCRKVGPEAAAARASAVALFAVMYARNNKAVIQFAPNASDTDAIAKIGRSLQERFNATQNAFGLSVFASAIISFAAIMLTYSWWINGQVERKATSYTAWCKSKFIGVDDCEGMYISEQWDAILRTTSWDVIETGAVTTVSVLFVLVLREARLDEKSWKADWRFHEFPFLRFFGLSVLSGFFSIVIYTACGLAEQYFANSFSLTSSVVTTYFQNQYVYLLLSFGSGLIVAFAALIIMDKHDHFSLRQSILWAICAAITYFIYTYGAISITYGRYIVGYCDDPDPSGCSEPFISLLTRDAFILSLFASLTFLLLAATLEWFEQPKGRGAKKCRCSKDKDVA